MLLVHGESLGIELPFDQEAGRLLQGHCREAYLTSSMVGQWPASKLGTVIPHTKLPAFCHF